MPLNDTTQDTPVKLCECGCGQPTKVAPYDDPRYGEMKGQPMRFIRGHNTRLPAVERFWRNVSKGAANDCWEWTGYRAFTGYGKINIDGVAILTHRYSYELHNGTIPHGMHVCHSCDNPNCVNPAHLFIGTMSSNMADKVEKSRQARGNMLPQTKFTESQVVEIRRRYEQSDTTYSALAVEYGVTRFTISAIVRRETWRHIP